MNKIEKAETEEGTGTEDEMKRADKKATYKTDQEDQANTPSGKEMWRYAGTNREDQWETQAERVGKEIVRGVDGAHKQRDMAIH